MGYVRGFAPWIAFSVVAMLGWQWGALAGLVLGGWLLIQCRREGVAADALILDASTVLFFAALTTWAFARPDSGLKDYGGGLSMGWLAVTAWATLVIGHPFTTGIARRQAPREVWDTAVFRRINVVISSVWAGAFTLTAAALAVSVAAGLDSWVPLAVQAAGFVLPALFTARYPERARARLAPDAARA
ncbi:hypothetical protein [Streptomyces sp. RTd22]|uniref:hypothetical protein n=1 Tax=Streptomyces sp. RTd22 TaxID=1841249 RepID=UPI0007C5785B|nr:hypothetical protein [Streptomyces sp. RTd22]